MELYLVKDFGFSRHIEDLVVEACEISRGREEEEYRMEVGLELLF